MDPSTRLRRLSKPGTKPSEVRTGSRFLNVGVDTQVTWPKQEMLLQFDQHQLVLMPKTKENTQSVHMDLVTNRTTNTEALTIIIASSACSHGATTNSRSHRMGGPEIPYLLPSLAEILRSLPLTSGYSTARYLRTMTSSAPWLFIERRATLNRTIWLVMPCSITTKLSKSDTRAEAT